MQIKFNGCHTAGEAAESLFSILKLFSERYGIGHVREMHLSVTLMDSAGEDVELVDAQTSEVLGIFEVFKSLDDYETTSKNDSEGGAHLRLVVDNTKGK